MSKRSPPSGEFTVPAPSIPDGLTEFYSVNADALKAYASQVGTLIIVAPHDYPTYVTAYRAGDALRIATHTSRDAAYWWLAIEDLSAKGALPFIEKKEGE